MRASKSTCWLELIPFSANILNNIWLLLVRALHHLTTVI